MCNRCTTSASPFPDPPKSSSPYAQSSAVPAVLSESCLPIGRIPDYALAWVPAFARPAFILHLCLARPAASKALQVCLYSRRRRPFPYLLYNDVVHPHLTSLLLSHPFLRDSTLIQQVLLGFTLSALYRPSLILPPAPSLISRFSLCFLA